MSENEKAPGREQGAREKLSGFLDEIAGLILPKESSEESERQLKQSKHAVLCILLDGKSIFGVPIAANTDDDVNKLLATVRRYMETIR